MTKKTVMVVLMIFLVFSLWASETARGLFKLVLHDNSGRFSLYSNTAKGSIPLFTADDPDTTYWKLYKDGSVFTLGSSGRFKLQTKKDKSSLSFEWINGELSVREDFAFIKVLNSGEADGLLLTMTVENLDIKNHTVGLRFLLDTYLGEGKNNHFRLNSGTLISKETAFEKSYVPSYWFSGESSDPKTTGFVCINKYNSITVPDRAVMANWKRLDESEYNYTPTEAKDFNALPYSVNDSAYVAFYDPAELKPKETRVIRLLFLYTTREDAENFIGGTLSSVPETTNPDDLTDVIDATTADNTVSLPVSSDANASAVVAGIKGVEALIAAIDKAMAENPVDAAKISALQTELDRLTAQKQNLSQ